MKVGDLVELFYAESSYYAIVIKSDPCPYGDSSWTFLFCDDGSTETYRQQNFDYGEVEYEVISESR